jgi:nucleoside-diphosphate-sugar epimerase
VGKDIFPYQKRKGNFKKAYIRFMVLVTGGTGLVGAHLLVELTKRETQVRAIYRRAHKIELVKQLFEHLVADEQIRFHKIEWIEADITNLPQLEEALEGISTIYHCAAFVSFEPDKYKRLRKVNIEGTANVVNLSIKKGIKKLCYVSSIAAIGFETDPSRLITEKTAWNPEEDNNVYAITKYGAEMEVWRGSQEGIDVIVVNPGIIIGGGFWKSGSSGSLMHRLSKGQRYYTLGITGYVGVNDVVQAMIDLTNSSIVNQGYILVSENLSFKDFMDMACASLGVKKPSKVAKPWLLELAWRLDWLSHKLLGKRRQLSKQMARSSRTISLYDAGKIKETLNFEFEPLHKVIKDTADWYLSSDH